MFMVKRLLIRDCIVLIVILIASWIPLMVILSLLGIEPFFRGSTARFTFVMLGAYCIGIYLLVVPLYKVLKEIIDVISYCDNSEEGISFDEISQRMEQTNILNTIFREYKKTLRLIESPWTSRENPGQALKDYYATVEAEYFFNEDTLVTSKINHKVLNFLPQLLIALGLLGTFLGIVQGVGQLNAEIHSSEEINVPHEFYNGVRQSNEVQLYSNIELNENTSYSIRQGIPYLLEGAEVSFVTSLAGVSLSLSLTMMMRTFTDLINKRAAKLTEMINGSLNRAEGKEGLKELERQLEIQTASIQKLATDLSEEVGRRFDVSLQQNLTVVSEKLNELIIEIQRSFESSLIEKISPALERMSLVSERLGNMQQAATNQFINDTISKMEEIISLGTQKELQRLQESLEIMLSKNQEFMNQFTTGMEKMESIIASQETLLQRTDDSANTVFLTAENLKDLQKAIDKLLSDVYFINSNHDVSIEKLQATIQKLDGFLLAQGSITEKLADMVQKTHELGLVQQNYAEKFNSFSEKVYNGITAVGSYIKSITESMGKYKEDFEKIRSLSLEISNGFSAKFEALVQGFDHTTQQLNRSLQEIESKIVARIDVTSQKIANTVGAMERLYSRIEELTQHLAAFAETERSTQELWMQYRKSFEDLHDKITAGVAAYTEKVNTATKELLNQYDMSIAEAVNYLREMVDLLASQTEDLSETFQKCLQELSSSQAKRVRRYD